MNWLRRPDVWLTLTLAILTTAGGDLLSRQEFVQLSQRDRNSYGLRPRWQAHFDALSATCGVGLLMYDLKEDYTPTGRWVLAGLGLAGALLYLGAARQAVGRLWAGAGERLPSFGRILVAYLVAQALVVPLVAVAERLVGASTGLADAAWQAVAAFSSLGCSLRAFDFGANWTYAVVALIGALGWPIWLGLWRRGGARRAIFAAAGTYAAYLLICTALLAALETPRGTPRGYIGESDRLGGQSLGGRYGRGLVQVLAASGAGLQTEPIGDRGLGEGAKLVLAGVILVGGLGGAAGGGIRWTMFLWALGTATALRGRAARSTNEITRRCLVAGIGCAGTLLLLWWIVALGLLLIDARIGSAFQAPPTVADALLDAASAVGGAGLTSGLTATVTSANLSIGIRQNVDLYQYGVAWLMLAMFFGRVLPVLVVRRAADPSSTDTRAALPPLI